MAYWHRRDNGDWYFDWSHLYPFVWLAIAVLLMHLTGR